MRGKTLAGWVILTSALSAGQQPGPELALDEAATAFEQGRTKDAEQKLHSVLEKHPSDLRALVLAGAVLDSEQRYSEAGVYYQRALSIAPQSAPLLNNVANHYLTSGDRAQARKFYLKAVAADPGHANANLQLARMSVEERRGTQALAYLSHSGNAESTDPVILEIRARALSLSGRCSLAGDIARRLENQPGGDWRMHFSAGAVYAECKLYDQAEAAFSRALDSDPRNFDILYNLGLAALHAGHTARAAGVFEIALNERPEDIDCLYGLSQAYLREDRAVDAAALLTRAERIAPSRADVLLLLAGVSAELEFYQDASEAYSRYIKLKPGDEVARRERSFALAEAGQYQTALPDLDAYARKHPRDALGFYELAVAQAARDHGKALLSLNEALRLDTALTQASYMRAAINLDDGKPAAAVEDLRILSESQPRNYQILVRLGQAYLALDRPSDAQPVLKRALDMAPNTSSVLAVYAQALEKQGRQQEATAILSRIQHSGASLDDPKPRTGLIAYLSLAPAEQRARYLGNLRKNVDAASGDFRLAIRLGSELLADGKNAEALEIFQRISTSDPEVLGQCGMTLLQFEQYEQARRFLESAVAAAPALDGLRLGLAASLFQVQGAESALMELDKTPETGRKGDYYLLRAQLLDSLGKVPEAAEALNRGMQAAPTRASLYFQSASFLLKHHLRQEALELLDQAVRMVPDSRELLLAQWVALTLGHRDVDARKLLARLQARWPEWDRPYLLNGILLAIQLQPAASRQALETAIALGANTPEVYYYQALAITQAAPDDAAAASTAIERALALNAKDPYICLLAGKIALGQKDYPTAVRQLIEATRLQPALIPAHYALRSAYQALGDEQKSAAELEEIRRIGQQNAADRNPYSVEDALFAVRPAF